MNPTSYTSPPSCPESQRPAAAQEGALSIEEKGDQLIKFLEDQEFRPPQIKAIFKYAIGKLKDVKPFISESVRRSAFKALTEYLRETIGEDEFERMARSPAKTVGDLGLDLIPDVYEIFQDDSQIVCIAREFIEPRIVDLYESHRDFDLGSHVFEIIHANHCSMTVSDFLNRINPDYLDISSLTLSEKA